MKCFVLIFLFTLGCGGKKGPDYISSKAKPLSMAGAADDVKLPSPLFDEIMGVYLPALADKEASHGEPDSHAKLEVPTDFFSFHVYMTEKTPRVLGGVDQDLTFGKGGGVLDLKDFVETSKGTFLLGIVPELPEHENATMNVFFLSNSKRLQDEGVVHGSGCDVYLEISDFFNKAMVKTGIEVNVAGERHVGLLSGTLFMAISISGKLYLSQLTMRDSRYKKLQCRD